MAARDPSQPAASTGPAAGRASGLLLHVTSLPEGCLGPGAHRFADRLAGAKQSWWQMLPVGPADPWRSPYNGPSAFAGNPHLVGEEPLVEEGLLPAAEAIGPETEREGRLRRAFAAFERGGFGTLRAGFEAFCGREEGWLACYALYAALRRAHHGVPWTAWDTALRDRTPAALAAAEKRLAEEIRFQRFAQFLFDRQWNALRTHCRRRGIRLLGDLPLYVAHESADVWTDAGLFNLDAEGRPAASAGVPPDYFNAEGQWWGNPLYRWDRMREEGYAWWIERLRTALARFDAVRLDHFIGIQRYWEIPRGARSAREGRWAPGPGADFLEAVFARLPADAFVAEDLGCVAEDVRSLRDRFGLPGMRVIQFAFDGDPENEHLPHRYPRRAVAYTGTHDNNTARGWFEEEAGSARDLVLRRLESDGRAIHWDLARAVFRSEAALAILPAQDLLGLGSEARMNRPGKRDGNWTWRLAEGALSDEVLGRLERLTGESRRGR